MKTRKFDKYLFWVLILVILLVALVLFITARPAAAASGCGVPSGAVAMVDKSLTAANIPHELRAGVQRCNKTSDTCLVCVGWSIRIVAANGDDTVMFFNERGAFVGVR
jgi:hypothetical protein